jgi:hypothetical protein
MLFQRKINFEVIQQPKPDTAIDTEEPHENGVEIAKFKQKIRANSVVRKK